RASLIRFRMSGFLLRDRVRLPKPVPDIGLAECAAASRERRCRSRGRPAVARWARPRSRCARRDNESTRSDIASNPRGELLPSQPRSLLDREAARRLHDGHARARDVLAEITNRREAILQVILVENFFQANRDRFQIASSQSPVGWEPFGENQ